MTNQTKHTFIFDLETFYDTKAKYDLRSLAPYEYILNPQFEAIMMTYSLDGADVEVAVGESDIIDALGKIDWNNTTVVAHNGVGFDFLILAWRWGIKPAFWFDTMVAWKRLMDGPYSLAQVAKDLGIPAKGVTVKEMDGKHLSDMTEAELTDYIIYGVHDTEICKSAYGWSRDKLLEDDLAWIDLCVRMATEPRLLLDKKELEYGLQKEHKRQDDYKMVLARLLAERDVVLPLSCWKGKRKRDPYVPLQEAITRFVRSDLSLAQVLEDAGYVVPQKVSAAKGELVPAFGSKDEPFKSWVDSPDVLLCAIAECRLATKSTINISRLERFLDLSKRMNGKCPVFLNPMGTTTGRNSGCLVAETKIWVYTSKRIVKEVSLAEVKPDDLVWDGLDFVPHEGVVLSGIKEVIDYDGITGTRCHEVFTKDGTMSLGAAYESQTALAVAQLPSEDWWPGCRTSEIGEGALVI